MQSFYNYIGMAYGQYLSTGSDLQLSEAARLPSYSGFSPMRDYLFARVFQKDALGILYFQPALTAIANLSDRSFVTRLDYGVRLLTHLQLNAFAMLHLGEQGEFRYEVHIPEGTPGFEDGLHIPAQRLELGLWLRLDF